MFITKINQTGDALVYSTYLGGSDWDYGEGIAVDSSGNAYLTGFTKSVNFPTQNPIQPTYGGGTSDAFVTKINPTGDALVYSTYLGGSNGEHGGSIAVDSSGSVYLTGQTLSTDFPTQNPIQPNHGGGWYDAFVTKINSTGDALVYSTYLGGSSDYEYGHSIAVDSLGNAYLTGYTDSTDFPTENPIQPNNTGRGDVFVTKINSTGDALVYSTYLGGSSWDKSYGIAVDSSGNVYLTGYTNSTNFPTQNPLQPDKAGDYDAFITKINPAGDALVYSTYFGGSSEDYGYGIAVDSSGSVYLTGWTSSINLPTQNPIQPNNGGGTWDAFVTKINPAGNALIYSTYLGGSSSDTGNGIAIDSSGNTYLTGYTDSLDFPTQNPFQPNNAGFGDVFVTKIWDSSPTPDIKADNLDGPVDTVLGDTLSVTVELNPRSNDGDTADWYIYADTPFGPYYYNLSDWVTGTGVTYSGPLFNLSPYEVLNTTGLFLGTYTFCFDVDPVPLYSDCVVVNVNPPLLTIIITSPADGTILSSSPITVAGSVTNNADVTVNGIQASVGSGTFTASIPLSEGQNTITAAAADQYGQTASGSITVTLITEGSITGTVTDVLTSLPLSYAMVSVTDSLNITQTIFTDTNGIYTINNIKSGAFSGSITKDSYAVYNFSDTMTPGQTITIDAAMSFPPPTISNTTVSGITTDSAIITWTTDHYSDSLVEYGETQSYGSTVYDSTLTRYHSITLTNLTPAITYHYRVTSTNTYGLSSSSANNTFTTLSAPSLITLDITSPLDGNTINRPDVMVRGTVINSTGNETGLTVNGKVATVYGNRFFVNQFPLQEGQNTITAIATDTGGNTASTSITVNAVTTSPYITLRANIESGISLTTYFSVSTAIPNAVTSYEMDYEGDGTVDYTGDTFENISFTYTAEGVYYPTVTVTDTQRITYSDTIAILVLSETELDTLLRGKWEAMKTALIAGDTETGLSYFVDGNKDRYRDTFTGLGNEELTSILLSLENFEFYTHSEHMAEGGLVRTETSGIFSYPIIFVKDGNGIWKIYGF